MILASVTLSHFGDVPVTSLINQRFSAVTFWDTGCYRGRRPLCGLRWIESPSGAFVGKLILQSVSFVVLQPVMDSTSFPGLPLRSGGRNFSVYIIYGHLWQRRRFKTITKVFVLYEYYMSLLK